LRGEVEAEGSYAASLLKQPLSRLCKSELRSSQPHKSGAREKKAAFLAAVEKVKDQRNPFCVMAGLVPAIHVFGSSRFGRKGRKKDVDARASPGMTNFDTVF
jgi:hypothetical protein